MWCRSGESRFCVSLAPGSRAISIAAGYKLLWEPISVSGSTARAALAGRQMLAFACRHLLLMRLAAALAPRVGRVGHDVAARAESRAAEKRDQNTVSYSRQHKK